MEANANIMQVFLSVFLTGLAVPLILRFIVFKTQSEKSSSPYTFKYPKFLVIFFLIATIIIAAVNVWIYLSNCGGNLELFIFLSLFYSIFLVALIWHFLKVLNFQLILEEEYMVYRNLWGIVKRIKYEDISEIKTYNDKSNNTIKYRIYIANKKIEVEYFTINFNGFPKLMKERLKKTKNNIKFKTH